MPGNATDNEQPGHAIHRIPIHPGTIMQLGRLAPKSMHEASLFKIWRYLFLHAIIITTVEMI